MAERKSRTLVTAAVLSLLCSAPAPLLAAVAPLAPAAWQDQTAAAPTRVMGTVTAVTGTSLTVQPDHGAAITVSVPSDARVVKLQPGQRSLSAATPIQLNEISVGDRVLASGAAASGGIDAHLVVAMKKSDIAQRQQAEEEAWQRNGVGGIVKSVDPATGTIVLAEAAESITVKTTLATKIRRYANNSVAFKDAQPSTLTEIRPGDQLRARGDEPPTNGSVTANAVVFGDFQNIAGLVIAVDPVAKTLTVKDLATRKPLTLAVNDSSQLRKLPEQVAQFVAMRMQAMKAGHKNGEQENHPEHAGQYGDHPMRAGQGFSRVLERANAIPLTDLHKGDAVLIVATEGSGNQPGTAITLLAGVEPMLRASTKASRNMFSSSWSLGGGQGGGGTGGDSGDSAPQQR